VSTRLLPAAIALLMLSPGSVAHAAAPKPFGRNCKEQVGVRFCPTTSLADRVSTWDGTPIDVDVTLPPTGDGPFPTLLLMHGLSSSKGEMETKRSDGGNRSTNVWYAQHGWAVLTPNERGHSTSCGAIDSRTAGCGRGWLHLADQRYEVRDMQHLLGLLVDEGIAAPDELGAQGCSYGSAITLELAMLRDRVRMLDGSYVPWRSPRGVQLAIKAGYATCAVADWVALLAPDGRLLDYRYPDARQSASPPGIVKASVAAGAGALLGSKGYVAPPLIDPSADFQGWVLLALGNPPDSPLLTPVMDELLSYHSAIGIDISHTTPAPMLIENGWADDYTPPEIGGLRMYRYLRGLNPDANVALQFADWGHQRSKQKLADAIAIHTQGMRFLDHYVRGIGRAPAPGSVTAFTQTCANAKQSAGPFKAPSWQALHPGEVRFGGDAPVTITEASSNPLIDAQLDPAAATPCAAFSGGDGIGVAVYRHKLTREITSLGLPTIDLDVSTIGPYGRLIAKLFDEAPSGKRVLITRGAYRLTPNQTGHVTFQLFGGGWRFEPGHTARLEIAGADVPFLKPAEAPFTARISDVHIALPTYERPDGGEIAPNSHLAPERCASTISINLGHRASRVTVRSGGHSRTLRNVKARALRLAVSGRAATVTIRYRSGAVRRIRRDLCGWV
jgi:hypothetical protein